MKKRMKSLLFLFAVLILSGCSGRFLHPDSYDALVQPYIEKWQKAGITSEQRWEDSVLCGSNKKAKYQPHFGYILREMKFASDKEEREMRYKLLYDWQRCMLKKSYQYTGKCYDTELSKEAPACRNSKKYYPHPTRHVKHLKNSMVKP